MLLHAPSPVDTRAMFRPVSNALDDLLRTLAPADWERSTLAGSWTVRDVVAHLLDGALRRLSFHRDRLPPPLPDFPVISNRDFVEFINQLNEVWVRAARRLGGCSSMRSRQKKHEP